MEAREYIKTALGTNALAGTASPLPKPATTTPCPRHKLSLNITGSSIIMEEVDLASGSQTAKYAKRREEKKFQHRSPAMLCCQSLRAGLRAGTLQLLLLLAQMPHVAPAMGETQGCGSASQWSF